MKRLFKTSNFLPKKSKPSRGEVEFKNKFYELMFELSLYNKFKKTYYLDIKRKTNYGYFAHLYLETGLSFDTLEDKLRVINQNLRCMWIMRHKPFQEYAEVQIVLNPVDESVKYRNPNVKPNEFYLGLSFSNRVQKTNSNNNCMFILAGGTGSGKTRYMYQVLLSWILNCSCNDVQIYLADVAKNEYVQFRNVKHVKHYASDLSELEDMMRHILKEINRRKKILTRYREMNKATNIEEYNQIGRLAYIYVVIDEFSVLVPDKTDSKTERDSKEFILDVLKLISKIGRSFGVFTLVATQKTTRDEIPAIIKNMSAVRISFKANDAISSQVIMNNDSAIGLPDRVAVYSLDSGSSINYLYSPTLTIDMWESMLKPYINHKERNIVLTNRNIIKDFDSSKSIIIPKGVDAREFVREYKRRKNSNNEGEYNDY